MTHISRKFLKGKAEQELIEVLIELLNIQGSAVRRRKVTRELLTGTERLMIAKRLAVICMLEQGISFKKISKRLKVSSSTPARLSEQIRQGKFKNTLEAVYKNKLSTKILGFVESLLIPKPRHGDRWKFVDDL